MGLMGPRCGEAAAVPGRRVRIARSTSEAASKLAPHGEVSAFAAADEADEDALAFESVGDDVVETWIRGAKEGAAAFDDVAFERGGGAVDQGGDDVAGFRFAGFEEGDVAVDDVGIDHRVAADDEGPVFFARGKAEKRGVDRERFEGFLFAEIGVAGGDGAVDGDVGEVGLDLAAFDART